MFKLKILTKSMGNATQEDVAKKKKKKKKGREGRKGKYMVKGKIKK